MNQLSDILSDVKSLKWEGPEDQGISSICFDSREAGKGSAFFAVKGTQTDGHKYIETAISAGAIAIVCEEIPDNMHPHVSYLKVDDSAIALGRAASALYGHPSRGMTLVGITGTNGKTTVATLLHRVFTEAGYGVGLISTVKNLILDKEQPATHTTPDPVRINQLLAQMADAGCEYCFMEVSSHAVHQKRIEGLSFTGGVFTNISHEHLDYHNSFREYINVKKAFFDSLPSESFVLVNRDDRNAQVMVQNCKASLSTFGLTGPATIKGKILESHMDGMHLQIDGQEMWTRLAGEFNASNLLAVYGTALQCGLEKEEVLTILSIQKPVRGRFETLEMGNGITAIVDYAHTPDALKNVLNSIVQVRNGNTQLITVVGAGGNRDAAKRPIMGKVAAEFSQKLILTSDNPRNEKPEDIIQQMLEGIPDEKRNNVLVIPDRKEAIRTAVMLSSKGDIILVAGKGHENYQEIEGKRFHFDDLEILQELIKST